MKKIEKKSTEIVKENITKLLEKSLPKSEIVKKPRLVKRCVSTVAREMIVDGKTNEEIWTAMVDEFHLDEKKKSYPNWYRAEMRKKGILPKLVKNQNVDDFAEEILP